MVEIDKWKVIKMWGARPGLLKSKEICILAGNPVPKYLEIGIPLTVKHITSWLHVGKQQQQKTPSVHR